MYDIKIKESVLQDLEEISEYIFRMSYSIELSNNIYDKIMASIISLKIFPYSFPIFENNYRVITIDKRYRVFYKVDEISKVVIVQYIF
ncbi:MAG: type II toxin-antitoxin system RelE/ParE family toxin [bacterium]|nr:type II toxin-antitoxin system RelE/ParE family toxin [bacterium]MDP3381252.1 type II toxin-antitoxin system RelE/ParE family toxin [bacterium]